MKTIIQVPVDKKLRDLAVLAAEKQGFSSLQDLMRLFLAQFVEKKITVGFTEPPVRLSKRNAERYATMMKDFENGKNISSVHSVRELLEKLNT